MQFWELFHLLVSDLGSEQYSLSHSWKPVIWSWFWVLCHSNPMNIDWIVNWRSGRERAPRTASFCYIPCCDTIWTRKCKCSQHCRNRIIEPQCGSNPAKDPLFYIRSGLQPHQGTAAPVVGWLWNQTELLLWSQSGLLVGYPGPFLTLAKPILVSVDPGVLPPLARHVGSNLQFSISVCSNHGRIPIT